MNDKMNYNTEMDRLRSYSSVFSRSVFTSLIKFGDFTAIDQVFRTYDSDRISGDLTYADYLDWMYLRLVEQYRTEYVFKNALINRILSQNKGGNITIFNEFRVGDSIADIATFNGKSCVYEIKTEFDSPKRLEGQQQSYFKFFQECYLVVPKSQVEEYLPYIDERMGVLTLDMRKGQTFISSYRKASLSLEYMDVDVLMRVLRISEYESIIRRFYGKLPDVGYFEMYDACKELMTNIPVEVLSRMAVQEIKKRKSCDLLYHNDKRSLTQMCLALNFNARQYVRMSDNLKKTITL